MSDFYLGGHQILRAGWAGPSAVYVDFATTHTTGFLWQLYANRSLIGVTEGFADRRIIGQLVPSAIGAPLTLVRVPAGNVYISYGADLPKRPWNRFAITWDAASYPADAHHFDITGSSEAGGDIDPENVLARIPFTGDGSYRFDVPALEAGGTWKFGVTPRDNAVPLGNAGTTTEITVVANVPPPDVETDEDGNRFTLTADGGVVTAAFEYAA